MQGGVECLWINVLDASWERIAVMAYHRKIVQLENIVLIITRAMQLIVQEVHTPLHQD